MLLYYFLCAYVDEFERFLIGGFAQKRVIKDELNMIYLDEVQRKFQNKNQNPHINTMLSF